MNHFGEMNNNYEDKVKKKHNLQLNNEENNPCFKEHTMSLDCLNDNNFDPDMCQLHFENYRNCKQFWNAVRRHRRINGVSPILPTLQERNEIKARFMETGKF